MSFSRRTIRIAVLALTLAQVVGFTALLAWRIDVWNARGTAGLVFQRDFSDEEEEVIQALGPLAFSTRSRAVISVAMGSPAAAAGIRLGDEIVAVNGVPVGQAEALDREAARLRAGDEVVLELAREGKPLQSTLRLGPLFPSSLQWMQLWISIAIGAAFLGISALVAWMRPRSGTVLVFYLMSTVGAVFYFIWALFEVEYGNMRGLTPAGTLSQFRSAAAVFVAYFFAASLLASLLLHFAWIFPRRRPLLERYPRLLVWVYTGMLLPYAMSIAVIAAAAVDGAAGIAAVVAAAVAGAWLLVRALRGGGGLRNAALNDPWRVIFAIFLVAPSLGALFQVLPDAVGPFVGVAIVLLPLIATVALSFGYAVATCVGLYRSYREAGVEEKRQLKWPLWGTIAAIGSSVVLMLLWGVTMWVAPVTAMGSPIAAVCMAAAVKAPYLLIPVAFAFAILKYRLMEIDLLIRKTAVYASVTGIILLLYLGLVGTVGLALIRFANVENQTVTVLGTLVIAVAFIPVRNGVQSFFDRRFFARRENLADVARSLRAEAMTADRLGPFLQSFVERVQQGLQARSAAVFVLEATSDVLALEAKVGLPDETLHRVELDADVPLLARGPRIVEVQEADLTPFERSALRRVGAQLALPVFAHGSALALLTVGRKLGGEAFDRDELDFLREAADHLSFAVANLRKRREEVEFEQAREIQRSLLPSAIPQREGVRTAALWKPAREVSGDYFDVLELEGGQLALCIGDVVGKGMPAALLMSSLQAAVRAIAPTEAPPDKVCTQVRRVVTRNLTGGKFVTFFYGLVDADTRLFRYANLGHNPPILLRADGTAERLGGRGGVIARLFAEAKVEEGRVALAPGDRILLFTDGASEARDGKEEEFGEERLVELVREHRTLEPEALLARIETAVETFSGGNRFDDITLVAVAVG